MSTLEKVKYHYGSDYLGDGGTVDVFRGWFFKGLTMPFVFGNNNRCESIRPAMISNTINNIGQ